MVEYSDSTKALFNRSNNKQIKNRGSTEKKQNPGYVEDLSKEVPVAFHRDRNDFLSLDINSTTVIGMFGPSGSGKTTGDMTIATRTHRRGRLIGNFADTDLHTTNLDNHGGVSKSLIESMGLFKNEEPFEVKQKTLLPKYLWNKMPEHMKPSKKTVVLFSLGFEDLTDSELKFLLGQGLDKNQKQAMQSVLDNVTIDSSLTFDKLRSACEENEDIHHSTAKKLKRNINVLDDSEVISNRHSRDIVEFMEDGYSLGVGMKGFSLLDPEDYYLMEFVAKKCFEKVVNARKNGLLDESVMAIFPEAHHLMPNGEDSLLADYVKRVATYHQRRADIPLTLDTQLPSQVSQKLMEEVNAAFIGCDKNGSSLPPKEWKSVLNSLNAVANPQKDNRRWQRKIQKLNHRDFLYVDASMNNPNDAPIVRFAAPLSCNP